MLLETDAWLLAITFIVSTLHSFFEFLAFKNGEFKLLIVFMRVNLTGKCIIDIAFWNSRGSDVEGMSVRTIL